MLRDNQSTYNPPQSSDLSVEPIHEVELILGLIDDNISAFIPYYQSIKDSDKENRISDFLVYHFNCCLREKPYYGFPAFNFGKNPTQAISGQETDIGVVVLTMNVKPVTIIEFEAKRFSETSNNKEYVCGVRGGMERFKRGEHGSHLPICGMFAYVQSRTSDEWIQKVNTWISELAQSKSDPEIEWSSPDEELSHISQLPPNVDLHKSTNKRKVPLNSIEIYHYFINLC
jgi:hypothetical protein